VKFNDEELSRILSAHANGELRRFGWHDTQRVVKCCINQAALGVDEFEEMVKKGAWQGSFLQRSLGFFDRNYNPGWPLGKFLRELEKQGLA
jgi:hypothetical protein